MGEIYFRQNQFPNALESFNKALVLAESQGDANRITSTSTRIADLLRVSGQPAEAIAFYHKAIQQTESARALLQSEDYRQSYFEGGLGAYVSMIETLLAASKPGEAFNYNERARSRLFLDVLGSKVRLSRTKGNLQEEEKSLSENLATLSARFAAEREAAETLREELARERGEIEQRYSAFIDKVRNKDREQASLMNVEPLKLTEIQALLDPGQTLLEYFVTPEKTFLWVVTKDRLKALTIPISDKDLAVKVGALRKAISELRSIPEYRKVARDLYGLLLGPALSDIKGKELMIVPHGILHYLPFQALYSPRGKYLIEEHSLSYLSSASLLQFTTAKRKPRREKILAVGNPRLINPAIELNAAESETREVARLYPGSTTLVKREATEEKIKRLSMGYDVLHFAAHAELRDDDPLSSAILLANEGKEDGRLEVREIFQMNINADLVVLSGCETGLGKVSDGDEFVGLTRAFIYAGTPSVIASLWKVEDSSTARLMASFYKNLKTMSKVKALRQAQLQLIRGDASSDLLARRGIGGVGKLGEVPEAKPQSPTPGPVSISTSHPYFWAPFILVGDGK